MRWWAGAGGVLRGARTATCEYWAICWQPSRAAGLLLIEHFREAHPGNMRQLLGEADCAAQHPPGLWMISLVMCRRLPGYALRACRGQ